MPRRQPAPVASSAERIAPCGMDCGLCSRFLAQRNGIGRSRCGGCRARNQPCTYLFGRCTGPNHGVQTGAAAFCFNCAQYPCRGLRRVDRRYRENYGMSFLANLDSIRARGLPAFLADQQRRHACPQCGELRSIHNGRCFRCESITRLIEKRPRNSEQTGGEPT